MSEQIIWRGSSSQWMNAGFYAFLWVVFMIILYFGIPVYWLVLPLLIGAWSYLEVACTSYEVTTERLIIRKGVLSKTNDYVEFYRVKDVRVVQPFLLRMLGLSNVIFKTADQLNSEVKIEAIPNGGKLHEELRRSIETVRANKNVRFGDY